jgi:hypothetical protein
MFNLSSQMLVLGYGVSQCFFLEEPSHFAFVIFVLRTQFRIRVINYISQQVEFEACFNLCRYTIINYKSSFLYSSQDCFNTVSFITCLQPKV